MGGSPCSGKSTIANILSRKYDLPVYHVDQVFYERHVSQITQQKQPTLTKWHNTPWDELWTQPHDVLLDEARACYNEHFDLILHDLLDIENHKPIIVEGTALLPGRVSELITEKNKAIWLVPDESFQRQYYLMRGDWVQGILNECRQPEQAFENWMKRDAAFGRWIVGQTQQYNLELIIVDGVLSIQENADIIAQYFRFEEMSKFG